MAAPAFSRVSGEYNRRWAAMTTRPNRKAQVDKIARRILANKARYKAVQDKTTVPWFFIACLHDRESGGNFRGVLHNGEHIIGTGRRTRLVPAGRGPFSSWEEAAIDAIKIKNLHKITDWSVARFAYEAERFNGFGYRAHGVPSAYLWSFTNEYQGGKYIADGVWSATAVDQQSGVMPVLKRLMEIDRTVGFGQPTSIPAPVEPDDEEEEEETPAPRKTPSRSKTIWSTILGVLSSIGSGLAMLADWKVAAVICLFVIVAALLFIGRERIKKLVEFGI